MPQVKTTKQTAQTTRWTDPVASWRFQDWQLRWHSLILSVDNINLARRRVVCIVIRHCGTPEPTRGKHSVFKYLATSRYTLVCWKSRMFVNQSWLQVIVRVSNELQTTLRNYTCNPWVRWADWRGTGQTFCSCGKTERISASDQSHTHSSGFISYWGEYSQRGDD